MPHFEGESIQITSLTRLVSQRDCIEIFDANFRNPIKASGVRLLIDAPKPPPRLDFGAIGHGYDYWFRTQICPVDRKTVESFLGYEICRERYARDPKVAKLLQTHTSALRHPATAGDALFEACLFLAKFEAEYRSGIAVDSFRVMPHNVRELARIAAATDLSLFNRKVAIPNPVFCVEGSKLRITADGDVFIGTTLIDLKTSTSLELKSNLRQLLGYVVLNDLGCYERVIDTVGVYYPRFNYLAQILVTELMTRKELDIVKNWFAEKLGKKIAACRH